MTVHPVAFIASAVLVATVIAGLLFEKWNPPAEGRNAFLCHVSGDRSAC